MSAISGPGLKPIPEGDPNRTNKPVDKEAKPLQLPAPSPAASNGAAAAGLEPKKISVLSPPTQPSPASGSQKKTVSQDEEKERYSSDSDDEPPSPLYAAAAHAALSNVPEEDEPANGLPPTAEKAQGIGSRLWGAFTGAASSIGKGAGKIAINKYAGWYANHLDKDELIQAAYSKMKLAKCDVQYVELTKFIGQMLQPMIEAQLMQLSDGDLKDSLLQNKQLIKDLIEINLTNVFANLAVQVRDNQDQIPNYRNQSTLVNILSLFNQKFQSNVPQKLKEIEAKYANLRIKKAKEYQAELDQVYLLATEDILTFLLPGKMNDLVLPMPGGLSWVSPLQNFLYNSVSHLIKSALRDNLEPVILNPLSYSRWQHTVQSLIPNVGLKSLAEVPAALLFGASKKFIESDQALGFMEETLHSLKEPDPSQVSLQKSVGGKHPYEGLAQWLLNSIQSVIQTKDRALLTTGGFIHAMLNNVTMALIAKSATLVLPSELKAQAASHPDQFLKLLVDQALVKFKSLQAGEAIPLDFWDDLIGDLPLPPFLKPILIKLAIEKNLEVQEAIEQSLPMMQAVEKVLTEATRKARSFNGGEQLITISKQITEKIFDAVLQGENSVQLVGDQLESLIQVYMPGLKLDESLVSWLKANFIALADNRSSSQTLVLLKQVVEGVLLTAINESIQVNFAGNGEDYAAQFLQKINSLFSHAFGNLNAVQRKDLEEALVLQTKMDALIARLDVLRHSQIVISSSLKLAQINKAEEEIKALQLKLETHLASFQTLTEDLMTMLGLDKIKLEFVDKLDLPESIKDAAQSALTTAKSKQIPLILFQQFSPLLKPLLEQEQNREKLLLRSGSSLWSDLAKSISKNTVAKLPEFIQDYEGIAKLINDSIPGARDLHLLLAPQIEAVVKGNDPSIVANRELIEKFIEGILLSYFVKLSNSEGGFQNIFLELKWKFQQLPDYAILGMNGRTDAEIAALQNQMVHTMVDEIMRDDLHISEASDLVDLPPALRLPIFEVMKTQMHQQLVPIMMPLVERTRNLQKLQDLSGSNMLGSIATALSKDVFNLLPSLFNSHRLLALKVFKDLSGSEASPEQAEKMIAGILRLIENRSNVSLTNKAILAVYEEALGVPLDNATRKVHHRFLKTNQVLNQFGSIVVTPEDIVAALASTMPHMDDALKTELALGFKALTHNGNIHYTNVTKILSQYVEAIALRLFIQMAEKNPKVMGERGVAKDSIIVITEKLLAVVGNHYQQAKLDGTFESFASHLNDDILVNILGLSEADGAFADLPEPLQKQAYDLLRNQIENYILSLKPTIEGLQSDSPQIQRVKEELKHFGENEAHKAYVEVIAQQVGSLVLASTPQMLGQVMGNQVTKGTNIIAKAIETNLEDYAQGNLEVAKVLLNYSRAGQLQETILDDQLKAATDADTLVEDKAVVAGLVANGLLAPLNNLLSKVFDFEKEQGDAFNRKLMGQVLNVAAEHIEMYNRRKLIVDDHGVEVFSHENMVAAADGHLHPAVPVTPISFNESIKEILNRLYNKPHGDESVLMDEDKVSRLRAIIERLLEDEKQGQSAFRISTLISEMKKELDDAGHQVFSIDKSASKRLKNESSALRKLIRQEGMEHTVQRQEEFYNPAIKPLMTMLFPNGKQDLTFVPENLRDSVWKMFRTSVFPMAMQTVVESIFDQKTMTQMVLTGLKSVRDTFKGEVGEASSEPMPDADPELSAAGGKLITAMLQNLSLPKLHVPFYGDVVSGMLIDPVTGKVNQKTANLIGASLTSQFNETFIRDKIKMTLQNLAMQGLGADNPARLAEEASTAEELLRMDAELQTVSRETVDAAINFTLRSVWKNTRTLFEKRIEQFFGKLGLKVKNALFDVFEFIFFKVIGSILAWLMRPLNKNAKKMLYNYMQLDANRGAIVDLLRKKPANEPEKVSHAIYHEDLVFKLVETVIKSVSEAVVAPRVAAV